MEEFNLHIKKLQLRAALSLTAIILILISIGFGILFLFVPSFIAVIFFVLAASSALYLIHCRCAAEKEEKGTACRPVVFRAGRNLSFEDIAAVFENLTDTENQLSASEDVRFFRLKKIFKLRSVLYRTADFDKKEFNHVKDRINKKASKELKISH